MTFSGQKKIIHFHKQLSVMIWNIYKGISFRTTENQLGAWFFWTALNKIVGISNFCPLLLKVSQFRNVCLVSSILPKNEQKIWFYYNGTSSQIVLIHFWGELKTSKIHFEINWPLKTSEKSFDLTDWHLFNNKQLTVQPRG